MGNNMGHAGYKICNSKNCIHYMGGAVGERFCLRGFWSETKKEKMPRLNNDAAVIRPRECLPGMEGINGKQF